MFRKFFLPEIRNGELLSIEKSQHFSAQSFNNPVFSLTFYICPASKQAFLNNYTEGQQEKILMSTENAYAETWEESSLT